MGMFGGSDPKDEIIALLNGIIEGLRDENAALRKQALSLTDKAAFALSYPRATIPAPKPAPDQIVGPIAQRTEAFKPTLSRAEIEDSFKRTA